VNLDLSDDQELFRQTCQRFLVDTDTIERARGSTEQAVGFDRSWWRRAAEIGLAAMFVPEEYGGGCVSGSPVLDAVIAAEELGRTLAAGPFQPVNVVADAIARSASEEIQQEFLPGLGSGEIIGTWAFGEPGSRWDPDRFEVELRTDRGDLLVNGTKSYVEAADVADVLLVTAASPNGISQIVVPSSLDGIQIEPLRGLDVSRRFCLVHFQDVLVSRDNLLRDVGAGSVDLERQVQLSVLLQVADSVGAIGAAFEQTCLYAQDRVAFGRLIGSFQAVKHKLADMLLWVESCRAIADGASAAVSEQSADVWELVHTAKAFVSYRSVDVVQECIQVHGGIGLTWEHDMHRFLRRVGTNRMLYGTPEQHETQLSDLLPLRRADHVR
jgi:alkylation response protein AidB-like acyl-CoA dehydrogenase